MGSGLLRHFGGRAAALVGAARGSVVALVDLLTAHFPGFRDHGVYRGRQVGAVWAFNFNSTPNPTGIYDELFLAFRVICGAAGE